MALFDILARFADGKTSNNLNKTAGTSAATALIVGDVVDLGVQYGSAKPFDTTGIPQYIKAILAGSAAPTISGTAAAKGLQFCLCGSNDWNGSTGTWTLDSVLGFASTAANIGKLLGGDAAGKPTGIPVNLGIFPKNFPYRYASIQVVNDTGSSVVVATGSASLFVSPVKD